MTETSVESFIALGISGFFNSHLGDVVPGITRKFFHDAAAALARDGEVRDAQVTVTLSGRETRYTIAGGSDPDRVANLSRAALAVLPAVAEPHDKRALGEFDAAQAVASEFIALWRNRTINLVP